MACVLVNHGYKTFGWIQKQPHYTKKLNMCIRGSLVNENIFCEDEKKL